MASAKTIYGMGDPRLAPSLVGASIGKGGAGNGSSDCGSSGPDGIAFIASSANGESKVRGVVGAGGVASEDNGTRLEVGIGALATASSGAASGTMSCGGVGNGKNDGGISGGGSGGSCSGGSGGSCSGGSGSGVCAMGGGVGVSNIPRLAIPSPRRFPAFAFDSALADALSSPGDTHSAMTSPVPAMDFRRPAVTATRPASVPPQRAANPMVNDRRFQRAAADHRPFAPDAKF
jgi:hypothetical protein